jgi:hypothetical protein
LVPLAARGRKIDALLALEELDAKTHTDMESNVAVHEPGTWVVGWVGDDKPSATWELSNVAARWVRETKLVEVGGDAERTGSGTENMAIVAVEMDRVGNGWGAGGLLDYPVGPLFKQSVMGSRILIIEYLPV